jgi:ankyrin repeat protein
MQKEATALMCAARLGNVDCARLLLAAGVDKEARDKVSGDEATAALCVRAYVSLVC